MSVLLILNMYIYRIEYFGRIKISEFCQNNSKLDS